jgi:hypothetical protein
MELIAKIVRQSLDKPYDHLPAPQSRKRFLDSGSSFLCVGVVEN